MLDRFNLQKPHTVLRLEGTLRMCIDYRALNKAAVKNKYHVPNMADLFDSDSLESHLKPLRVVFSRLREYQLYVKKGKCELCCQYIMFLGHLVRKGKIHIDGKKVQAILDWPAPTKRHYLLGTQFTVVTDNVANTYFKTQKKLTPKKAHWQEFLSKFDVDWVHIPGKLNQVADVLSHKEVQEFFATLTLVHLDFLDRIRDQSNDSAYIKLQQQVREGLVRRYWLEDDLLYAKGGRSAMD
ncbi:unnamed protein product [Prunus brigantina]